LTFNLAALRERARGVGIIGVVKANAYGHGAVDVASRLVRDGVEALAVATVPEAVELRCAGVGGAIMVFGAPRRESVHAYEEYDLEPFVTSVESIDVLRGAGRLRVHVHVDTGMARLGIRPEETRHVIATLEAMPGIEIVGLSTHFATAGEPRSAFAAVQWRRFTEVLTGLGSAPAPIHLASSGAFFTIPESLDASLIGYARPGIGLYGLLDLPADAAPGSETFRPVMTLVSEVVQVRIVLPDTPVSYDGLWRSSRETRIATISAGYADGYPRNLTNRGVVGIGGGRFPVAGVVCMDLLMVDLGPESDSETTVHAGDPAVLFGAGGPSAVELARLAGTIPYELVCRVSSRVPRLHRSGDSTPA
jgi:alanine racemase